LEPAPGAILDDLSVLLVRRETETPGRS